MIDATRESQNICCRTRVMESTAECRRMISTMPANAQTQAIDYAIASAPVRRYGFRERKHLFNLPIFCAMSSNIDGVSPRRKQGEILNR